MTAQNIPAFDWSENALNVRGFLYQYWCDHGHGPNLRDVHEGVGLPRRDIIAAYKELGFGEIVFDQMSQNFFPIKCPPFSSPPSQVSVYIDDEFHCFAGCAMESVAISRMPPFEDKELRLETYCACCLAPISLLTRNGEILSTTPDDPMIHVSKHPDEWGIPNVMPMCDSMNYVLDADHADRYERMQSRRGVLFNMEQAQGLVKGVADNRMWDFHWNPGPMTAELIVEGVRSLGVDVSNWDPS